MHNSAKNVDPVRQMLSVLTDPKATQSDVKLACGVFRSVPTAFITSQPASTYPAATLRLAANAVDTLLDRDPISNQELLNNLIEISNSSSAACADGSAILINAPTMVLQNADVLRAAFRIPNALRVLRMAVGSHSNRLYSFKPGPSSDLLAADILRWAQYQNWSQAEFATTVLPYLRFNRLTRQSGWAAIKLLSSLDRPTRIAGTLFLANNLESARESVGEVNAYHFEQVMNDADPRIQLLAIDALDSMTNTAVTRNEAMGLISELVKTFSSVEELCFNPDVPGDTACSYIPSPPIQCAGSFQTAYPKPTCFDLKHFHPDQRDYEELATRCFEIVQRTPSFGLQDRVQLTDAIMILGRSTLFRSQSSEFLSMVLISEQSSVRNCGINVCGTGRSSATNLFPLLESSAPIPAGRPPKIEMALSRQSSPHDDQDSKMMLRMASATYSSLRTPADVPSIVSDSTHPMYRKWLEQANAIYKDAGYMTAEELVGDFITERIQAKQIFQQVDRYDDLDQFADGCGAYSYVVFRNFALDAVRSCKRRPAPPGGQEPFGEEGSGPIEALPDPGHYDPAKTIATKQLRELVQRFLEEADDDLRRFFIQKYIEGRTLKEIGNGNVNVANTLDARLKRRLKAYFISHFPDFTEREFRSWFA